MNRKPCLLIIPLMFGFLSVGHPATAQNRPNVILVLADDMGYGDVAACNPQSKIPTPHIDRLAREGMIFTDAHSSSAVCTPTRYSLLTGRYHWRTRLQSGVIGGFSRPLIAQDRLTLGGLLQQHGYHTACIGKWHLGMDWPLRDGAVADDGGDFDRPFRDAARVDYTAPIRNGPVDRGFDHFYGISASLDMFPYVWIEDSLPTELATETKAFHRPGPAGKDFEAIDVQPGITRRTLEYIAERAAAAKAGNPFFAYVPLAAPHTPIVPTPEFQGASRINPYGDFVRQIDADMGRLLDALDQHDLTENTLVVFTTDNGCSPAARIDQLIEAGHNPSHIYRGHKADLYEGGHRVPFLARWPGKVPAGAVSQRLIGQFDLLATFADLLGATLPPDAGEDSVSFLPVLLGQDDGPIRRDLICQSINGSFAIRDGHWKLAFCPGSGGWSSPRPRDDSSNLPEFQLFDLQADPGERTNLVEKHPERVATMRAALETAIARGRTTPGPDQANDANIVIVKPLPVSARANARDQARPGNN
jgi:arylsulfatase A